MCGRPFPVHRTGFEPRRDHHGPFGLDMEKSNPKGQVVAALAVLAPVALSGIFLVVFVPELWWIFAIYFWVAFPSLGLLARGISGLSGARPAKIPAEARERELLGALREHGELTPARAATETSLTVAEADQRLRELAEGGHLEVRARGGGIFYALWEAGEDLTRELGAR